MDNDETECVKGEDQKTRVTSTHVGRWKRVCRMCGRRRWEYEHGGRREQACGRRRWKDENEEVLQASAFSAMKGKTPKLPLGVTLSSLAKNDLAT